jgi:hypothetical protein
MDLTGTKIDYESQSWPYLGYIPTERVQQQLHIPIPSKDMLPMFHRLSDYNKSSSMTAVRLSTLEMIAQAVHNTMKLRGYQAPHFWNGSEPRVMVLLSYITRRIWENEEEQSGMWQQKDLLSHENVCGVLFSIFIMDEDLSFDDAISDQWRISTDGMPVRRKSHPKSKPPEFDIEAPLERRANSESVDSELDEDTGTGVRLDVPGKALDHAKAGYWFRGQYEKTGRKLESTSENYKKLNSMRAWAKLVCGVVAGVREPMDIMTMSSSNVRIGDLPHDSVFRPENCFSLDAALAHFQSWGAHRIYSQRSTWLNAIRSNEDCQESFGMPCWSANGEYHFLPCTALFPLEHFRAFNVLDAWLPHTKQFDTALIQPQRKQKRTEINMGDDGFVLENFMEEIGFVTSETIRRHLAEEDIRRDIFNAYFSDFAERAAEIDAMLTDPEQPSAAYVEALQALQRQGLVWYNSRMDIDNQELPASYRALIQHTWEFDAPVPQYEPMWQARNVAMSPYAQLKARDLVLDDGIIKIADNTLLLKPRMLRAIYTAYLPKLGTNLNKEHMQYVGTPGTSKSHTLNKLSDMLIDGTWEAKSGGSNLGMIGSMKSERMLTLYHELPNLLAPDGEYHGDADKYMRMKLAQLGDGITEYSSTREILLPDGTRSRELFNLRADYTSVVIGARNYKRINATPGGPIEAIYDRWSIVNQMTVVPRGRVSLIHKVLETNRLQMSTGMTKLKHQYQLQQRCIMEYGALIAAYCVPLPDLSLFSTLAPMAVSYLAELRPELHFKLRNFSRLCTRIYVEVMLFAVRMAVNSVLNPGATKELVDGELKVKLPPYETESAMREVQLYGYCTLDQIVFVLTEAMYEMTNAESFAITEIFAQKYCNYWSMGKHELDRRSAAERPRWQEPARVEHSHLVQINTLVPERSSLDKYVDLVRRDSVYELNIPTNAAAVRARSAIGKHGQEAQYNRYELTPVEIDPAYEQIFTLNAPRQEEHFRLDRPREPQYKLEVLANGMTYVNPNYVVVKSELRNFAKLVAGRIGNFQLGEATVQDILTSLTQKTVVTPYMPCVHEKSSALRNKCTDLQSLRYIRRIVKTFPKYKVPVLIENRTLGEFYMLVSYFETNPYAVVEEMIAHICYAGTFERRSIMGIPSQGHCLRYEPVELRAVPRKKLVLPRKNNLDEPTQVLLREYLDTETIVEPESAVWSKEDIEHTYAMRYLRRYNPLADRETLERHTPRGMHELLYGDQGHYTQNARLEKLLETAYPQCFEPVKRPAPPPPAVQPSSVAQIGSLGLRTLHSTPQVYSSAQASTGAESQYDDPMPGITKQFASQLREQPRQDTATISEQDSQAGKRIAEAISGAAKRRRTSPTDVDIAMY